MMHQASCIHSAPSRQSESVAGAYPPDLQDEAKIHFPTVTKEEAFVHVPFSFPFHMGPVAGGAGGRATRVVRHGEAFGEAEAVRLARVLDDQALERNTSPGGRK